MTRVPDHVSLKIEQVEALLPKCVNHLPVYCDLGAPVIPALWVCKRCGLFERAE